MPNSGHPISELIKERELAFSDLHPNPAQTDAALELLRVMEHVLHVEKISERCLVVRYDVRNLTLEIIEAVLVELGFHLEPGLLRKLKSSLYHYTEEVLRSNLGITRGTTLDTKDVFINRYQKLFHGCRDTTPPSLRHYR
ncbi:MAG: hypothetical protein AB1810_01730 [Pseudomonadota bacterium]